MSVDTMTNYSTSSLSGSRLLGAYLGDIKIEFTKMIRTPAFAVPTLFFPAMFYVLFGVVMQGGDPEASLQIFARMGVFGTMAPGLFGFGVSLAFEREYGQLTFKQALPTPPGSYLLARMLMAMLFASIIATLLIVLAVTLTKAPLTAVSAIKVFFIEVLGVLPFCAMGLFVGSAASGQAAPAIVNIIYLPMAFLSGLWFPLQYLKYPIFQEMAPLWPSFHLSQIALHELGKESFGSMGSHFCALIGITLLFFTIAVRRLSGAGVHMFGARRPGAAVRKSRLLGTAVIFVSIALIIAGVMGGHEKVPAVTSTVAAEDGAGSPVTGTQSAAPVGVTAPETTQLANFDGGSTAVSYGLGWIAADDKTRGGDSVSAVKLTSGGAAGSKAAMEVAGTVGTAIAYPFAGTVFFPAGDTRTGFEKWGFMDYSKRKTLRFQVRGDGQDYLVMFIGPVMGGIPAMYHFTAGQDWKEVSVPLRDLAGLDLERVKMVGIGTMTAGPFRFEIDDVRIE